MRQHSLFAAIACVAVLGACAPADPLAGLTPDDKVFLFAGEGTDVPFLGQAVDNGPLNCYPQRMGQGYVLIDDATGLWLNSIRPTGVERHKVLGVTKTDTGFDVKAQNGVRVPFELQFERQGADRALISWDGAPAALYRRCPQVGK
jgi:hypothetical protein